MISNNHVRMLASDDTSISCTLPEMHTPKNRILLIDDEPAILMSVAMMLESQGFQVAKSDSANSAFELLNAGEFDCIVIDYCMPEMNGLAALQQIRSMSIETPVILCSGLAIDSDEAGKHSHWPEGVLYKPFRLAQLLESIALACCK